MSRASHASAKTVPTGSAQPPQSGITLKRRTRRSGLDLDVQQFQRDEIEPPRNDREEQGEAERSRSPDGKSQDRPPPVKSFRYCIR